MAQEKKKAMIGTPLTDEEKAMIRAYKAQKQKEFWAKMTPEERRAKRALYLLHTLQNKQKREAAAGE